MTGTTRFLVRMPTSSMEMTSSGLVIASTRLPLSSRLRGMSRRRTMKSRGSRPRAAGCGVVCVRSTTPRRIWPATAVTMSCSLTRPSATSISPRRPPPSCWRSRAPSSCSWVTRPLATSRAPSLRRPAARCVRPLVASASSLRRSSSGENGLVMNSAAPTRCACSNVEKSLSEASTRTGVPCRAGSPVMRRSSSKGSKVCRSRSRTTADGGSSRSRRRVPGSPRLVVTAYAVPSVLASSLRSSVSSSMIARVFLDVPGTRTSHRIVPTV